jgi:hypothetical protein
MYTSAPHTVFRVFRIMLITDISICFPVEFNKSVVQGADKEISLTVFEHGPAIPVRMIQGSVFEIGIVFHLITVPPLKSLCIREPHKSPRIFQSVFNTISKESIAGVNPTNDLQLGLGKPDFK